MRNCGCLRISLSIVLQTRSNSIAWNPMEAFNFTVANEDCNLYTYDMRKLQSAACMHKASALPIRWHSDVH